MDEQLALELSRKTNVSKISVKASVINYVGNAPVIIVRSFLKFQLARVPFLKVIP